MNVFVIGDIAVEYMFETEGYTCVDSVAEADLVCFTGGEDVSPFLYGEKSHPTTWNNIHRDYRELCYFGDALHADKPMVGICRGGQFLNVMCGGKLWQNVEGHALYGTHTAIRIDTGEHVQVTSTHHQMMIPASKGRVLLKADWVGHVESYDSEAYVQGIEAVIYHKQKVLCFQPHPEYGKVAEATKELFFDLLNKHLLV